MYPIIVTLQRDSAKGDELQSTVLQDIIWALAPSEMGLQHVRVSLRDEQLDIVLFCLAENERAANHIAVGLCRLICTTSPLLQGWRLKS